MSLQDEHHQYVEKPQVLFQVHVVRRSSRRPAIWPLLYILSNLALLVLFFKLSKPCEFKRGNDIWWCERWHMPVPLQNINTGSLIVLEILDKVTWILFFFLSCALLFLCHNTTDRCALSFLVIILLAGFDSFFLMTKTETNALLDSNQNSY